MVGLALFIEPTGEPANENCVKGALYVYYKKGGLFIIKESFFHVIYKACY
jgi:hypothetical protein